MAAKTQEPSVDDIMSPKDMKPILAKSKQEPVSCVLTLARNKDKDGVILLDWRIKPKKLVSELRKLAAKAKIEIDNDLIRFGRALVDTDVDSRLVQIKVNKAPPGVLRPKVLERLKLAGYSKVDIFIDAKLDEEPEEVEASPERPAAQPSASEPQTDAAGPQPPTPAAIAAYGKARTAWLATRQKVEIDIDSLQKKFSATFKGHTLADDLEAAFKKRVEPVLERLDNELAHTLEAATKAKDGPEHAKLVAEAKRIMQRYQAFVAGDPTLAELDENPLVPLAIQKTLTTTLDVLAKTIV